jgi:hypothetical protein
MVWVASVVRRVEDVRDLPVCRTWYGVKGGEAPIERLDRVVGLAASESTSR